MPFPVNSLTAHLCKVNHTVSGTLNCSENELIAIRRISYFLTKGAEHNCRQSKGIFVYPTSYTQLQMEKLLFNRCSFASKCTLDNENIDSHRDGPSKTYVDYSCEKRSKYYSNVMHIRLYCTHDVVRQ